MLTAKEAHARSHDNNLKALMEHIDYRIRLSCDSGDFIADFDPDLWSPTAVGEALKELREAGYEVTEDLNVVNIEW